MTNVQTLELVEIFTDLKPEQLELIYNICTEEIYQKSQVIFEENTPSREIFVILKGEVDILVNVGKSNSSAIEESKKITTLRVGQSFGEIALVDQGLRSATARCASDSCKLLVINRDDFMNLLQSHQEIGFQVMSNLASDLCFKIRQTTFLVRETLLYGV